MVVGIVDVELHLPEARSLKAKRRVISSLIERVHGKYRVSIAQVGHLELHQRAGLGIAVVGIDDTTVGQILDELRRQCEDELVGEAWVTRWDQQLLEGQ